MTLKTFIKSAALGVGALLLVAGLAMAQTPAPETPAAAPAKSHADQRELRRKIRHECHEKTREMKGAERRDTMRQCVKEASAAAGLEDRGQRRAHMKGLRAACQTELKDQRFTEAERSQAMRDCLVKKEPSLAKGFACRDEARTKNLKRGSKDYRGFLRECESRS